MHVKMTPSRSVDNTGNDIVLQEIANISRVIEQKRWKQWVQMEKLAEEAGFYKEGEFNSRLYKETEFPDLGEFVKVERCAHCGDVLDKENFRYFLKEDKPYCTKHENV